MSDSEILCHPRLDILKLLSEDDYDPYRLCKELGLTPANLYKELKFLEKEGLTGGKIKYYVTDKGRDILSRIQGI